MKMSGLAIIIIVLLALAIVAVAQTKVAVMLPAGTAYTSTDLSSPTNQASTVTFAVAPGAGKFSALSTNNHLVITGVSGIDPSGTNVCLGSTVYTNNSVGEKTITIPAAWIDLGNYGSSVIYNTNQGRLAVMVYPGMGTNFLWSGK